MIKLRSLTLFMCVLFLYKNAQGQFSGDLFFLPKKGFSMELSHEISQSSKLFSDSTKSIYPGGGKFRTSSSSLKLAYSPISRLNFGLSLPFIKTKALNSDLSGQSGLQDYSIFGKLSILDPENPLSILLHAIYQRPFKSYDTENQPLSIGLGTERRIGGISARYKLENGFFVGAYSHYENRNNISLSKSGYFNGSELIEFNKSVIPDLYSIAFHTGIDNNKVVLDIYGRTNRSLTGTSILAYDFPHLTNKAIQNVIGLNTILKSEKIGIKISASYLISGSNTIQNTNIGIGLLFNLKGTSDRFEY